MSYFNVHIYPFRYYNNDDSSKFGTVHVKKTAYGAAGIAVESECMELGWRSTLMFDLQSTSNFLYICLHSMLPLLAFFPAFTFTQHDFNTNC